MTDWTVSAHKLILASDQDDVTGYYPRGFTTAYTIEMFICPRSQAPFIPNLRYTRYEYVGYTEHGPLDEGDMILDQNDNPFEVMSVVSWTPNELKFYVVGLEAKPYFALPESESLFWGFEDLEHGTIGGGFDDNFERGYMIDVTY